MSEGTHSVAFYCPYCGDEDLEPDGDRGGRWHCHSCTRTFTVTLVRPGAGGRDGQDEASGRGDEAGSRAGRETR